MGTAYAVIFWIQNIGLLFIPLILGFVLNSTNPDVSPNKIVVKNAIGKAYNETLAGDVFTKADIFKAIEKSTGTAVDSVVQYANYEAVSIEEVNTDKVENEIYSSISTKLKTLDLTEDKDILLAKVLKLVSRLPTRRL